MHVGIEILIFSLQYSTLKIQLLFCSLTCFLQIDYKNQVHAERLRVRWAWELSFPSVLRDSSQIQKSRPLVRHMGEITMPQLLFLLTYRAWLHEESWQCRLLTFSSRFTAHLPISQRIHSSHVARDTAMQSPTLTFRRFYRQIYQKGYTSVEAFSIQIISMLWQLHVKAIFHCCAVISFLVDNKVLCSRAQLTTSINTDELMMLAGNFSSVMHYRRYLSNLIYIHF